MNRSFVSLALVQSQILGKPLFPFPIMHCFSLVVVVRFIIKHISSQMMTSHCSKLMENVRTEISIAMLCIFNTLDAILSVREDDVLLIYYRQIQSNLHIRSPLLSNNLH